MRKRRLEERRGIKKHVFVRIFNKATLKNKFLIIQGEFSKIIQVIERELCFLSI